MLFARIENGAVLEVIPEFLEIEGEDVPLSDRYHPDFVAQLVPYDPENFPDPEPEPVHPPAEVTMRQARLALHRAGLLDGVEDAIEALPDPARTEAKIEWEFAATVRRDSPIVAVLSASLELSEDQLNDLFTDAATL